MWDLRTLKRINDERMKMLYDQRVREGMRADAIVDKVLKKIAEGPLDPEPNPPEVKNNV
jgi:hypothetical protein